ncbi:4Fe-4S binding protein [Candidatus Bathyarchaeota archaeon]|nr:4Fe-4S binding protein [Candidatus Bathyarchaeota archaeon]
MNWIKDRTKRVSMIRTITQLVFLLLIFYISIVAVWKGLLLVVVLGATVCLGRLFCGWACPLGLYLDLTTLIRRALRIDHWSLPRKLNENLHKTRYLIALAITLLVLGGTFSMAADFENFVWLRPPYTPFAFMLEPLQPIVLPWQPPFGALAGLSGVYLTFPYVGEFLLYLHSTSLAFPLAYLFVFAVLAASFKVRRVWCRFCPTGVSAGALNRFRVFSWIPLLRLSKKGEKCTKCGICQRVCPVQVTEVYEKKDGDIHTSMCTVCLRCVEMCPERNCLSLKLAGQTIYKSRSWLDGSSV